MITGGNRYRVDIYAGVRSNRRGGIHIISKFGKYEMQILTLYKSHTKSDDVGLEEEADSRVTLLSKNMVRFGIPAGILVFIGSLFGLYGVWQDLYLGGDSCRRSGRSTRKDLGFPRLGSGWRH